MTFLVKKQNRKRIQDLVIKIMEEKLSGLELAKKEHGATVAILGFVSAMSEVTAGFADALIKQLSKKDE